MVYWACVLTALSWVYILFASQWPRWFAREAVKHSLPEAAGYRIGRMVHWRLPTWPAVVIAALSLVPMLGVIVLNGWPVVALLALMSGLNLLYWFNAPPGLRLSYLERQVEGSPMIFELRSSNTILRSALMLLVGLIPALGLGALLNQILAGFIH